MNKAITIMLAALAAFAGFPENVENVRTDSAGNVYARFGSLGRNSFVATNVVEGLPLSGGDMTGPLNMGFNPITFNGSTNSSEWALWDMLRAWPTGADGPVLLPFVITNAIAREVDGVLNGSKPFTAFNVNLPLGAGMSDPLQNFWVNGTNLHDWVQILAPVSDLSAGLGAFSATGSVLRASRWGTEDRWTDATGVVWRATFDPWNDRWTIEPAEEARNMYIRWDGDTWVFGHEGVELDTNHGADAYSMTINLGTTYTAVRHPGGAPEAVDRVAFATDLATNTPPLALAYGTPTRWTDATGCVWEVVMDIHAPWTLNAWGDLFSWDDENHFWVFHGPDDTFMEYLRYESPGLWHYDSFRFAGSFYCCCVGKEDNTSLVLTNEYDSVVFSRSIVFTNLVGRVALTNDLASVQPGDYETVSNRAMHAVQQVGDEIDVGNYGVISWGPNSGDYKLSVGDNSLATGWLFRWEWGTICLPYMEGDNVVALLGDIPSWARASSKPSYTASEVGAIAASDATNVVRRIVSVTSDYVWDAQAECLYRRSMENQFLYWTPVTNVNALLPENAHILEYLEEHKND